MIAAADLDQALGLDRRSGPAAVIARAAPGLGLIGFSFIAAAQTFLRVGSLLPLAAVAVLLVLYNCRAPLGGIRAVPFAGAVALLAAVAVGGLVAALAPAAIVVAVTWSDCDHRRVRPDRDSVPAVAAAVVLGFLLSGMRMGPLSFGSSRADRETGSTDRFVRREPTAESSFVERLVRDIVRFLTGGETGSSGDGRAASPPPPEPDPMNWRQVLLTLIVLVLVVALMLFVWRLMRRWLARRRVDGGIFGLVRRFDRIGARTLRDRRTSEGLARYGAVVSDGTGDRRVAQAGELLSDVLYNPESITGPGADAVLTDLETDPPLSNKPSWRRRFRNRP